MKTETKQEHTPGPWKALDGAILCEHVNNYGNFHIARFDRGDAKLTQEDYANANLIASAPDLLHQRDRLMAACKEALYMLGCAEPHLTGTLRMADRTASMMRKVSAIVADVEGGAK